jgi:epoxyqueuosine reductase
MKSEIVPQESEIVLQEAENAGFALAAVTGNRYNLDNCRSILAAGLVYGNDFQNDVQSEDGKREYPAKIAPFARRNYYREAVRRLQAVAKNLRGQYGGSKADYRIYCNSSVVNEKKIAFESGMADMGRNTLLLTKDYGSLFIAGLLTLPFAVEDRAAARIPFALCRSCDPHNPPCKKACPTGAIIIEAASAHGVVGGARIEKERCIQWYLSGHGEAVPEIVKKNGGNRLYGCTLCQDACVFHQKTVRGVDCTIGVLPAAMDAQKIAAASDADLKKMFHGTALGLSWLCPDGLRRNAALCLASDG